METRRIRSRFRKSADMRRRRKRLTKIERMKLETEKIFRNFLKHTFSCKNRLSSGDRI